MIHEVRVASPSAPDTVLTLRPGAVLLEDADSPLSVSRLRELIGSTLFSLQRSSSGEVSSATALVRISLPSDGRLYEVSRRLVPRERRVTDVETGLTLATDGDVGLWLFAQLGLHQDLSMELLWEELVACSEQRFATRFLGSPIGVRAFTERLLGLTPQRDALAGIAGAIRLAFDDWSAARLYKEGQAA